MAAGGLGAPSTEAAHPQLCVSAGSCSCFICACLRARGSGPALGAQPMEGAAAGAQSLAGSTAQLHPPVKEAPEEAESQPGAIPAWLYPNPSSSSWADPAQPCADGFGVGTKLRTDCSGEGLSPPHQPRAPAPPLHLLQRWSAEILICCQAGDEKEALQELLWEAAGCNRAPWHCHGLQHGHSPGTTVVLMPQWELSLPQAEEREGWNGAGLGSSSTGLPAGSGGGFGGLS